MSGHLIRDASLGPDQDGGEEFAWRGVPALALRSRRAQFLAEMDRVLPWATWAGMIEPHYPKRGKGRPPYPLLPLLRLYMVKGWWELSDQAAQEMATDSVAVREFMGLGLTWDKAAPDETTLLKFRRLLDRCDLASEIATDVAACLAQQGWRIRAGEIAEAFIVANAARGSFPAATNTGNANPAETAAGENLPE